MEYLLSPETWAALLTIIGVDIVLSGDNAVVIALACRRLPPKQQTMGIALGSGMAVALRIIFTIFIAYLLNVPYLKVVGGLLLFWVGYKLAVGNDEGGEVAAAESIWQAVRIVVIADAVMSLDNVIAVAAAAKGDVVLLILGLLISIPMVVYGAKMLIKLIERFPIIVPAGAALIGFIGGEVIVTDKAFELWLMREAAWLHHLAPVLGAVMVIVVSRVLKPLPSVAATSVVGEAAAGATMLMVRALLLRLVPLILGSIGYGIGDSILMEGEGVLMQVLHGLRPIFAAVIAIILGEALARLIRARS